MAVLRMQSAGRGPGSAERGARRDVGAVPLRPRGVGGILDASFDLFARRFAACAGIAALLWFPARIAEYTWLDTASPLLPPLVVALELGVQMVLVAFVSQLVAAELRGRRLGAGDAVVAGLPRVPGLLGIAVVAGVLTFVGWLCCICTLVPVVPAVVMWLSSVAPAAYVLERVTMVGAVERSIRLVRHSFGRWLGWFVTAKVMFFPLAALAVGLDAPELRARIQTHVPLGDDSYLVLAALLSSLFVGAASAYTAIAMTVYYVDNRAREEGFDLHLALDRLGSPASAGARP